MLKQSFVAGEGKLKGILQIIHLAKCGKWVAICTYHCLMDSIGKAH